MAEEFPDFAAIAQEAAKDLLSGLNVEEQIIAEEHDLKLKLLMWDNIIEHLNSLVAEKTATHKLLLSTIDKLNEIRAQVESYEVEELRLVSEEKALLKKISEDNAHRNWKLVRIEENVAKKKGKKFEKLGIGALKNLKRRFSELEGLFKRAKAIKLMPGETRVSPEEFEREEDYYFLQIWRFAAIYTKALSDLISKEEDILRRVR